MTKTHALLSDSPAIDAGDTNFTPPHDFDQRGAPYARVADGGVEGLRIDIGAFERQTVPGLNPMALSLEWALNSSIQARRASEGTTPLSPR